MKLVEKTKKKIGREKRGWGFGAVRQSAGGFMEKKGSVWRVCVCVGLGIGNVCGAKRWWGEV